jgi:hypothetical protein
MQQSPTKTFATNPGGQKVPGTDYVWAAKAEVCPGHFLYLFRDTRVTFGRTGREVVIGTKGTIAYRKQFLQEAARGTGFWHTVDEGPKAVADWAVKFSNFPCDEAAVREAVDTLFVAAELLGMT